MRELQPDALIYVQSILPVTRNNNYNMDNNRIDEFNQALLTLCGEKQVYYLNVAECMKDECDSTPLFSGSDAETFVVEAAAGPPGTETVCCLR